MAILDAYSDADALIANTAASAAVLTTWRRNLLALDDATRLHQEAFCGGFGNPQERAATNPYREWYGGFRFMPGMTSFTIVVRASGVDSNDRLRVFFGGSQVALFSVQSGMQTYALALPGGFSANQAIDVRIDLFRQGAPDDGIAWGDYEVIAAWVDPVTNPAAWPGCPAFTNQLDVARTQQLANAIDWLAVLVGQRTRPLFQSLIRVGGPFTGQDTVRWFGSIERSPQHATVRAAVSVIVFSGAATEQVRMRVNGAVVATFAVPQTPGEHFATLEAGLPGSGRVYIEIDHLRTAGAEGVPISRFSLYRVWAEENPPEALITIPDISARTPMTWDALRSFLNACSTAAETLKARIDANPDLWTRQYLFRRRYAYDDYQDASFEPAMVATRFARAGQALLVRGRGVSLGYGPQVFEPNPTHELGYYQFEALRSERVTDGDDVETSLVYLDGIPGLYGGDPYNLRGAELHYAGEILRLFS